MSWLGSPQHGELYEGTGVREAGNRWARGRPVAPVRLLVFVPWGWPPASVWKLTAGRGEAGDLVRSLVRSLSLSSGERNWGLTAQKRKAREFTVRRCPRQAPRKQNVRRGLGCRWFIREATQEAPTGGGDVTEKRGGPIRCPRRSHLGTSRYRWGHLQNREGRPLETELAPEDGHPRHPVSRGWRKEAPGVSSQAWAGCARS